MELVYTKNQMPVYVGDEVQIDNEPYVITYFDKPHKPASSGKISVQPKADISGYEREFYVQIIGAEWIDREDQ